MLKQRFLVHFGTNAITHFVGMLAGILVARIAGPSVVGVVSYGTAYVSILGFVNGLFGSAHTKLVSEGRDHADCMAVYARLQGASVLLYFLFTAGWFLIQKYALHYKFESKEVQIVIVISLLAHFLSQYQQYAQSVYTANLKQAKANVPNFVRNMLWHVGRVAIVLLGFKAVALSAWNLLLFALMIPFLYKLLREYPLGQYDRQLAKQYFKYSLPILIIVIVNAITHYADKLLLAHFTNTTQLGYYSAAQSIGGMFLLIAVPVGTIFFPLFSSMIAKGDWHAVNENIRKYQEFIILFVFPIICTMALAGGPLLVLVLGKRYEPSVNPFIFLSLSSYVVLLGLPYGNIISGMGRFYLAALINIIKVVIFIASLTVLIAPSLLDLGGTGVAMNLLFLNIVTNALYLFFAKRYGNIHLSGRNNIRQAVIITIGVAGYFISLYLKVRMDLWWLIFIPAYLVVTYMTLYLTRLINMDNLKVLMEAMNVRKTIRYANKEMKE